MCGISGIVTTHHQLNARLLTRSLHHRGPDHAASSGFTHDQYALELGHTRLSILDLSSNGNQPMTSPDGRFVIVFNGEIYNYRELKNRYLQGHALQSNSDTEVLLHLFQLQGKACLQELNGDFAFALYDRHEHQLHLVRDRAGVKPLYYYQDEALFCFASELKTLFDLGVPRKLNRLGLSSYLIFKYSPENDTLIEGIKRLGPGEMLTLDLIGKKSQIETWWKPQKNVDYAKLSYKDAQHLLYETVSDAVNLRLISDVPVGAFLSGGIDSSIIAHFLRGKTDFPFYCATKSEADLLKEGSTSDAHYARLLAQKWKLDLHEIPISADEANAALIRETVFYGDDLIADGSQIPSLLITRALKDRSRVILSGMGADEIFLGYAGHQLALLAQYTDKLPKGMANWITGRMSKLEQGNGRFLAYKRYLHKFGKAYQQGPLRTGLFSIVGEMDAAAKLFPAGRAQAQMVLDRYFQSDEDPFDQLFQFEYHNFLQKNLNYLDRMAMANSVEGRVPFMDHRLIELAYSLPTHYKLGTFGNTKRILKDTFAPHLPKEIIHRRKAGFGMPLRSILRNPDKLNELLQPDFFDGFDGFSMKQLDRIKQQHLSGQEDHSALLYALISLRIWIKEFVE